MLGELTEEQIVHVLSTNVIGRIGCYADEKSYVVPVAYLYDDGCLLGHTIRGMKTRMLEKNPKCCFETHGLDPLHKLEAMHLKATVYRIKIEEKTGRFEKR